MPPYVAVYINTVIVLEVGFLKETSKSTSPDFCNGKSFLLSTFGVKSRRESVKISKKIMF